MSPYGQYCPIAQALDILGERWTLLIVRDMLTGTRHFNQFRRRLPGMSSALLSRRLRELQHAGLIEKRTGTTTPRSTEYYLTEAGLALEPVIQALLAWGAEWAFGDPSPEEQDPLLLMWWMHDAVDHSRVPLHGIVIQFNFYGAKRVTHWLILNDEEATVCQTDPDYPVDVLVEAELATFFKLWLGRLDYDEALARHGVKVTGAPRFTSAFPTWFTWSPVAPAVRAVRSRPETLTPRVRL